MSWTGTHFFVRLSKDQPQTRLQKKKKIPVLPRIVLSKSLMSRLRLTTLSFFPPFDFPTLSFFSTLTFFFHLAIFSTFNESILSDSVLYLIRVLFSKHVSLSNRTCSSPPLRVAINPKRLAPLPHWATRSSCASRTLSTRTIYASF